MTGARIEVDDAAVLAALDRLAAIDDDLRPLWQTIGEILVSSTKERFRTETDPVGLPWAPLSQPYASRKKGAGILKETGQLAWSIVWQLAGDTLLVGTNRPHAETHQFGAHVVQHARSQRIYQRYDAKHDVWDKRWRKKAHSNFARWVTIPEHEFDIPRRAFLGISDVDRSGIEDAVADFLDIASGGALTAGGG